MMIRLKANIIAKICHGFVLSLELLFHVTLLQFMQQRNVRYRPRSGPGRQVLIRAVRNFYMNKIKPTARPHKIPLRTSNTSVYIKAVTLPGEVKGAKPAHCTNGNGESTVMLHLIAQEVFQNPSIAGVDAAAQRLSEWVETGRCSVIFTVNSSWYAQVPGRHQV